MTPTMLIDVLASLRGRVRLWSAVYGFGVVLAIGIAGLSAIAVADWLLHLSRAWRLLLELSLIGLVGWVAFRRLAIPLTRAPTLGAIAARVERRFPQFQDRLQSAVAFIQRPTPDSPALQRATIQQAIDIASGLPLHATLDPRPAFRAAAVGLVLTLTAVVAVALLDASSRGILLARLFNPTSRVAWPNRVELAFIDRVPDRVPSGGTLDLKLRLVRGDSDRVRPVVHYIDQDGVQRQEFLSRADEGHYAVSLDVRSVGEKVGALKWWVVAGDARSDVAEVAILPKLVIESTLAEITQPDYVRDREPTTYDVGTRSTSALVGSQVALTVRFNKPIPDISSVQLLAAGDASPTPPVIEWSALDDRSVVGRWSLAATARFRIDARDVDGFAVSAPIEYEIVARPDEPPTVVIESPRRNSEERTAEATIPLIALAGDDAGIENVSLIVRKLGESAREWTLPLLRDGVVEPSAGSMRWTLVPSRDDEEQFRLEYGWSLAALQADLQPGDVLEYVVRVTDNFVLDGNRHEPVDSAKARITIISQEQLANRAVDEIRQVRRQVDDVKKAHDRATADTRALGQDVLEKLSLDQADRAVAARLRQQLGTGASAAQNAAERLRSLREMLAENKSDSPELQQLSKDAGDQLAQTADGAMKSALQDLTNAETAASGEQRSEKIDNAVQAQLRASDELASAMKRLDEVGSLNAAVDEVKRALEAQRSLLERSRDLAAKTAGQTLDRMAAPDREAMEAAIAEQAALAEQTQNMLDRLGKTAEQLAKADAATADAMKGAQKQGQQRGVAQSQKQASEQMRQSQQAKAREAQQKAEAGLEVVLGQLQEAQSRKLAELQKKLSELQQQIAILIRRQSGHNLDNLLIQGGDIVAAEVKTIEGLRVKAERKAGEPAPTVARLLAAQGQTERNARDIAKKASDVPDGTEPASRVSRAASLMERAAVYVRDKKLAEAYQPPQVDALGALEEAAKVIDEQKQKVDDDISGQQQEAIRQAFIRVRGEQDKLAAETKRLDAGRNADGKLNRVDAVRVGLLPGEQQKLIDELDKVGDQLLSLKSVVYIWANKQIAEAMSDAKAKLAQSETALPTQTLHVQILSDLDAMIENLKVTPREQRFEQGAGGEGGASGGGEDAAKPMPAEAELRMLKALQGDVNARTKRADDDRAANVGGDLINAALVQLGRRQGEIRTLLDQLMSDANNGAPQLPPADPNQAPLPEEAELAKIDDKEIEAALLGGEPGGTGKEVDLARIGDRMTRSAQRLEGDRDAGRVTQVIQRRILQDFDLLIEAARQQQKKAQGSSSPSPSPAEQQPPGEQQAQNTGQNTPSQGQTAGEQSSAGGLTGVADRAGKAIDERAEEWGRISPRLRGPVLESRDETPVGRYLRLIQDYTQAVSTEASGGNPAPANPSEPIGAP